MLHGLYKINKTIHDDLSILMVKEEARKHSENYLERLSNHCNPLAIVPLDNTNELRRLKRTVSYLIDYTLIKFCVHIC